MSGKTGKSGMRRRDAIKTLGALAGASTVGRALPGCGDNAAGGPDLPDGLTTLVVLMMENRSYDHLLGARAFEGKPGDGLTMAMRNPDAAGNLIAPYPGTFDSLCVIDPPHGWGRRARQLRRRRQRRLRAGPPGRAQLEQLGRADAVPHARPGAGDLGPGRPVRGV
jgi:phospholipase C